MSFHSRTISIIALAVLTALPVARAVCTMLCDSAASTSAHHSAGKTCNESARSSTDAQVLQSAEHNCSNHDTALRHGAMTASARAYRTAAPTAVATPAEQATSKTLSRFEAAPDYNVPPGTAPPTTAPLVLRI